VGSQGVILERAEAPRDVVHQRVDRPPVYVCADTKAQALDWARRNKPDHLPKAFNNSSEIGPRGLMLSDGEPVFVLGEMPQHIRESWHRTGGNLVFL
jgi:hypothetical protein